MMERYGFIELIRRDLIFHSLKYYEVFPAQRHIGIFKFLKFMFFPEFAVIFWYRLYSKLFYSKSKVLHYLGVYLYLRTKKIYATDISPACSIGSPFKIGHHMGIVIGPSVIIGDYVYIFNGVTIGNKNVGLKENKMPTLGNRIIVGAGARLLGDISVADNSIIGANSILVQSTGERELWAGVPARYIKTYE